MSQADGSPTAGAIDGAQLALRMIEAAESAAAAAKAAATRPEGRDDWYKMLPKPSCFEPKDRDSELSQFRDWWWSVEQYLTAVDTEYSAHFDVVRQNLNTEIDATTLTAEQRRRGAFLYGLLASLLKNRPLLLLKGVQRGNGFEAVRQLFKTCQPSSRNRALGLLHLLMKWPEFDMKVAMISQILRLEDSFREYERIGGNLSEELKFAILMKCITGQLKTYLNVTLQDNTTYDRLREAILQYDQATIKWSNTMALGSSLPNNSNADDGPSPMEVDRIWKGKGYGKDNKGKGKDGKGKSKNKSSSKNDKGSGKSHFQKGSWNNSWGSGKGKWNQNNANNSDKGGKSSSKGKGHSNNSKIVCWKCNKPGHVAKDCRVRLVEFVEGENGDDNQQHDCNAASSSSGANNSPSSRVNRVSLHTSPLPSDVPLFFNLSGCSDFSKLDVRVISGTDGSALISFHHDCGSSFHRGGNVATSSGVNLCNNDVLHAGGIEYVNSMKSSFELCSFCKHDDFKHFMSRVSDEYEFAMYDVVIGHNDTRSLVKHFDDSSSYQPGCDLSSAEFQDVRAIKTCSDIILDSGSDATVIPVSMISAGKASEDQSSFLRDAQGGRISTEGVRDVTINLITVDGKTVTWQDQAHVSSRVDTPLISYGKLLKHGWGIVPEGDCSYLVHSSGAKVPISFKQNSLLVTGVVRMIEQVVRTIEVDIPRPWQNVNSGWYRTRDGFPICASHGRNYVDVLRTHKLDEWPYRTTLGFRDHIGWQVIELCQSVFQLDDREAVINPPYQRLLTLLSKNVISVAEFGMVVTSSTADAAAGSSDVMETTESSSPVQAGGAEQGLGGAQQRVQPEESNEPRATPVIPTSVAIQPASDTMTIAGVEVKHNSSIAVLKAACQFLEISQSGSKAKLWNRILAAVDRGKILEEKQLAEAALLEGSRVANPVQTAEKPSDEEVQRHMLTHIPYAAWCESCVRSKGKPERHERNESRICDREIPTISFDFAYTGKSLGADIGAGDEDDVAKLTTLVVHDSHTGSINCIPLRGKDEKKHAVREMVKYLQYLGYGDVCLMCDQEPSVLAIQVLLQRTWQRLGFKVVIENAKVLDHGGNSWAEKAIDRIRTTAGVFLNQVCSSIGHEIPVRHPLFSWAFVHAAWVLDRFSLKANITAFELVRGHSYRGKLCQFGEPLMCFVGDTAKKKGDAKWRQGIFITKSVTNDMFLVHCDGNVRLTRSVKSIYKDWSEHMGLYRSLVVQPWQIEGTLGNKIDPTGGIRSTPEAVVPIDDEVGDDVESDKEEQVSVELIPVPRGMKPPPRFAAVAAAVTPPAESVVSHPDRPAEGASTEDMEMLESQAEGRSGDVEAADDEVAEPASKRPRMTVMRVGDETLCHMDADPMELCADVPGEDYDEYNNFWNDYEHHDMIDDVISGSSCVWQPYSEAEPDISGDQLAAIDVEADKIEIDRLLQMGVITGADKYNGNLDSPLSAKMVRTWRKKKKEEQDENGQTVSTTAWLRRSRLVGRDFNFLEYREDVYSPASSSAVVKLLPCMAVTNAMMTDGAIATLDVSDAFLQVPQPTPRKVSLEGAEYVILKCLPGQRDASKLWYAFFIERLRAHVDISICPVQPCIIRCSCNGCVEGALLLHVDDVLILGRESWISDILIPSLQKEFKLTYSLVKRSSGGMLEFLKRMHVVEANYDSITVYGEPKHANALIERYTKLEGRPPRIAYTPMSGTLPVPSSNSTLLSPGLAAEYRSMVGIAMYMSQERYDLQYTTKTLASCLKNPTKEAWMALGRLIGYLRFSEQFGLKMKKTCKGCSFMQSQMDVMEEKQSNLLETFSDSDWSGSADMKSTSSAVHMLNGVVIHSTSRSQKCISLSSTEAEWYAASSSTCDGFYLQHIIEFLTCNDCERLHLYTDNSAVRMLSLKCGVGRLRHIKGRMLWLQEKMSNGELEIKQVQTAWNVADLNTKGLSRDRFLGLLFMLGFVNEKGNGIGEYEYSRMLHRESMKQHVKVIAQNLRLDSGFSGGGISSLHVSKVSKKVLRILSTCALLEGAEGVAVSLSPIPRALGHWLDELPMMVIQIVFTMVCMAIGVTVIFRGRRQNRLEAMEELNAMEVDEDNSSVTSVSTDWGHPLSESQERIFHVLDNGNHSAEAICEWMRMRCSRRLAVADADDHATVRFYHDALVALATTRRNLLTCDDEVRQATLGYLRNLTRLSPRSGSPISQLDIAQIDFSIAEAGRQALATIGDIQMDTGDSSSDTNDSLLERQRRDRYRFCPLGEASDPDLWMEVNHGGPDQSSSSDAGGDEPGAEPLSRGDQLSADLHDVSVARRRAMGAVNARLNAAYNGGASQEEIWALEETLNEVSMM